MKERILVIDDNMNDVLLMRRVLERAGYEVAYASTGEEGLIGVEQSAPQCILVDYRMPGMDGYEFCRRLKSHERFRSIPVLMLTGADAAKNVVDGLESGADDFVTKSSDIEVILARVRALLRVKAYQDQIVEQSAQLRILYDELTQKTERIVALNQRLNRDLAFARRVQEALLPQRDLKMDAADIRSAYIPSEALSGDFYDYFSTGNMLYLFMADVSGHGLPSAILVALLKSYLHSEADTAFSLAEFMRELNDFLFTASLPSQFATALLCRVEGNELKYSNAAHPPFLLMRKAKGKAELFEQPGHLLGAMSGVSFEEASVTIEPGDTFFSYTDGLIDRQNAEGEFYSIDRVATILESSAGEDLSSTYQKIFDDATSFVATDDYKDDIAFVLTRFR
jgi:serine phosphatase RsbU (regulator of sigma subunit)